MKLLALDIETSYIVAGVWGLFKQNVAINQILDPGGMICWAAKWVGKKEVVFRRKGEKGFLTDLQKLLNEADAVLSYNGQRFDIKKINREFLLAGLPPPAPTKHIDLLKTVKAKFYFCSNKLQNIAGELGIGAKVKHEGFELWTKCLQGDKSAWGRMKKYNVQDVLLLEKLYKKVQGWIGGHPSYSLAAEARICTNCGSSKVQSRGYQLTKVGRYKRAQCQTCGHWQRERHNEVERGTELLVSL